MAKKTVIPTPVTPGGPPLGNVEFRDSYLRIKQNIESLRASVTQVSTDANTPKALTEDQLKQAQQALQAGGSNFLNLTALPGILMQPQAAEIPEVTSLPNIANSSDGQLVLYRKVIWRFSKKTHKWSAVSTILLLDYFYNLVNYLPAQYAPGVLFYAVNTGVLFIQQDLVSGNTTTPTWVPSLSETVVEPHSSRTSSGHISVANNNAGAVCTQLSGPPFSADMATQQIWIEGNLYPIQSVPSNNTLVLTVPRASNNNANYVFEYPSVNYPPGAEFYETDRTVSYFAQNASGVVAVVGNNVSLVSGVPFDVYWNAITIANNVFPVVSVAQNKQALVVASPPGNNNNLHYSVPRGGWFFKGGVYSDALANIPVDLDPILDLGTDYIANQTPPYGGFRFRATDYRHSYWWMWDGNGAVAGRFNWAPEETGAQYIVATNTVGGPDGPDGGLWGLCDGSSYPIALSDGTTGNATTPQLSTGAFIRGGNNGVGTINAANRATWAVGAKTDTTALAVTGNANNFNGTTDDEATHFHAFNFAASNNTLLYTVGVSSAVYISGLVNSGFTGNGSPHNHTFSVAGFNFNANVTPNPHSHNLSNSNAVLNAPTDANGGLPLNIQLLWWMRR